MRIVSRKIERYVSGALVVASLLAAAFPGVQGANAAEPSKVQVDFYPPPLLTLDATNWRQLSAPAEVLEGWAGRARKDVEAQLASKDIDFAMVGQGHWPAEILTTDYGYSTLAVRLVVKYSSYPQPTGAADKLKEAMSNLVVIYRRSDDGKEIGATKSSTGGVLSTGVISIWRESQNPLKPQSWLRDSYIFDPTGFLMEEQNIEVNLVGVRAGSSSRAILCAAIGMAITYTMVKTSSAWTTNYRARIKLLDEIEDLEASKGRPNANLVDIGNDIAKKQNQILKIWSALAGVLLVDGSSRSLGTLGCFTIFGDWFGWDL